MAYLVKIDGKYINIDNVHAINYKELDLEKDGVKQVQISAMLYVAPDGEYVEFFEVLPENNPEALRMLAYFKKARI